MADGGRFKPGEGETWKGEERALAGRSVSVRRAEEGPAVVCPTGDSVALGEGGAGRGWARVSQAWALCSMGGEHRVQIPAGRNEALSCRTPATSVLTKGFLPYSLILGLLHLERM